MSKQEYRWFKTLSKEVRRILMKHFSKGELASMMGSRAEIALHGEAAFAQVHGE